MPPDHQKLIDCKASLEAINANSYLVNIKAVNGDHIELPASGLNHAADRLRSFAKAAGYNVLYAEGLPAYWRQAVGV